MVIVVSSCEIGSISIGIGDNSSDLEYANVIVHDILDRIVVVRMC